MKNAKRLVADGNQKNVIGLFQSLCGKHSRWNVWADFITMAAISISNAVDQSHFVEREETYRTIQSKYSQSEMQVFADMLCEVVLGMEQNPDQDFLGELFMRLELGNDHRGQFFTPYTVCRLMAEMQYDVNERIENDGWISVGDPACGAGALLVAFANVCTRKNINFQTSVLFVAQDMGKASPFALRLPLSVLRKGIGRAIPW